MANKKPKEETSEEVELEQPTEEEMFQTLYRAKSQRIEQLEVENARLVLMLQQVAAKLAEATSDES